MEHMNPHMRFSSFSSSGARRVSSLWQVASAQPGWVNRLALMTFILVIAVPVFLLVVAALIAASAVFGILWGFNFLLMKVRGILPRSDVRENVRVIRRREPPENGSA